MSGEKTALAIALEQRGDESPGTDEVQMDLLGLPETQALKTLRESRAGKIGRPPNARNRRTVEMTNYLLNRYTSPLEVLAQIAVTGIDELVAAIGCTKLEALQEKRLAAIALAPYVHAKMPVAVDVTSRREIHLTIVEGLEGSGGGIGLVDGVVESVDPKQIDALAKPVGEA